MKLLARGKSAGTAATPAVCGSFSLSPYSLSSSGAQTPAGSPVVISSSAAGVTPILGCVATAGVSPNWRYLVTASSFVNCATGLAIPGLSPSVETFTVDVDCTPGKDMPASVTAEVSVPVANAGGYIDIEVGVNETEVQTGCKQAEVDAHGLLHFGQSWMQDSSSTSTVPGAFTGIGFYPPYAVVINPRNPYPSSSQTGAAAPASAVQQFVGSVNAGGQSDAFFTGLLQMPGAPQAVTLVQAFAPACPAGQMNVRPHTAECVTFAAGNSADTTAQIADVFVDWPGRGSVAASVVGAHGVALQTSLAGPHFGTLTPPVTGYDDLTHTQVVDLSPASMLGLYGSLLHSDELLALTQDPALGLALVALELDEATGLWSARAPIALSTFSIAQQQAMGLFGKGGCYPMPVPVCDPASTVAAPIVHLNNHSGAGLSGTATLSFTHVMPYPIVPVGTPVDAAHPLHTGEQVQILLQWSASGLAPGQYAYAAIDVACGAGYSLVTNPNGGSAIEMGTSPCLNGYYQTVLKNGHAFPAIQASAAGGVSENLAAFTAEPSAYVDPTNRLSWSIPVTIFVSSTSTPDPSDVAVYSTTAVLPLYEEHVETTVTQLSSSTVVAPGTVTLFGGGSNPVKGVVYKLRYYAGTSGLHYWTTDYLPGTSTIKLLPPAFNDPSITVTQVAGSATTIRDGSETAATWPGAVTALGLNTNFAADFSGPIPTATIDNLLNLPQYFGPEFTVEWFAPLPTATGTTMTLGGEIDWGSNVFDTPSTTYPVSPVPVNELRPLILVDCDDTGNGNIGRGPESKCQLMYGWHGTWQFVPEQGHGILPQAGATLLNGNYVIKKSPNEHIVSTSLGTYNANETIYVSEDASCDNTNLGSAIWSDIGPASTRTDWSAVQCVRYQFHGFFYDASAAFKTALNSDITAGAPPLAVTQDTATYWVTADNVTPDPLAADPLNTWAVAGYVYNTGPYGDGVATWKNTTELELYVSGRGGVVPVDTFIHSNIGEGGAWGLDVPDLTINIHIAPGAVYDNSTTPESWFTTIPKDVNGVTCDLTCTQINSTLISCFVKSPTSDLIPAPGYYGNWFTVYPRYKFIASESYNGEIAYHSVSLTSSASWLQDTTGQGKIAGLAYSGWDTVEGPNQITIDKSVEGAPKDVKPKQTVPFDIVYGALGLDSGALGAGGVAIYDFFGKNYLPGANGAPGTLVAQSTGCAAPIPVSVKYLGHSGGTGTTPPAPDFFYTVDATPDTTASTVWLPVDPSGAIPAAATGLKIVPQSSLGGDGVLLPIDGTYKVQVNQSSAADATGKLCNSAALTATGFNPSSTSEASVPFAPGCDANAWQP
jgi:hypothetical protein